MYDMQIEPKEKFKHLFTPDDQEYEIYDNIK